MGVGESVGVGRCANGQVNVTNYEDELTIILEMQWNEKVVAAISIKWQSKI